MRHRHVVSHRRAFAALGALATAAGCVVGPAYHKSPAVSPATAVGIARTPDTVRALFDSVSRARAADSTRPAPPRRAVTMQSLADLAWLDILDDTALIGLVRTAVAHNPDVALAQARIREYRANADAVTGALFPRVTANGSAARNQVVFGGGAPVRFDALSATANLAWELDFWGKARRGMDAVNADVAQQEAAERAAVLSLVGDVATGYLQLLELDQEHDIAERTLTSRRATLALAQQRFAQGVVSELDVRQFEAQLAAPLARLAQVERLRTQQEHALNVLLGEPPMPVARGTSLVAASRAVTVPDSLPGALLDRRPDVTAAERAYAGAMARVGVAAAARLPSVTISGYYGSQSPAGDRLFSGGTSIYSVQAGVSIPLYTGGQLRNAEVAALARADQAKASYEKTTLSAYREAGDALVGARTARDEMAATETEAAALRRAYDLAELRYRNGISSYLEVLDAERSLFDSEIALAQSRLRELVAAVQLYKALGGSWTP